MLEQKSLHPIVNIIYFFAVMAITMIAVNPIIVAAAFIFALIKTAHGRTFNIKNFLFSTAMFLGIIIMNALFVHRGATILFYLNRNPITLESMLYGIVIAVKLLSIMTWFSYYNKIMTSDKVMYLFGRLTPSLSLIFSMILRFVPRYKMQFKAISDAKQGLSLNDTTKQKPAKSISSNIYSIFDTLSAMTTWALENSIDTADAMKSKGYGVLPRRTSFSLFRFKHRDCLALIYMLTLLIVFILCFCFMGATTFYPVFSVPTFSFTSILAYTMFLLLCLF